MMPFSMRSFANASVGASNLFHESRSSVKWQCGSNWSLARRELADEMSADMHSVCVTLTFDQSIC